MNNKPGNVNNWLNFILEEELECVRKNMDAMKLTVLTEIHPFFLNKYAYMPWLIFRVLKKIDSEHFHCLYGREAFQRSFIIFTDTTQNYKIEPNRSTKNKFLPRLLTTHSSHLWRGNWKTQSLSGCPTQNKIIHSIWLKLWGDLRIKGWELQQYFHATYSSLFRLHTHSSSLYVCIKEKWVNKDFKL